MSRRDTIIIAVLVNAGLLMVLFATATRSSDQGLKKSRKTELASVVPIEESDSSSSVEESFDDFLAASFSESCEELILEEVPPTEPVAVAYVPEEAPKQEFVKVTVKNGDFLERIARQHGSTVAAIIKANKLPNTNLRIGQVLDVPVKEKKDSGHVKASAEAEYYVVKDGDSPWLIASKNRVQLEELLRLNGLDEQKARRLRPGDKLRIR